MAAALSPVGARRAVRLGVAMSRLLLRWRQSPCGPGRSPAHASNERPPGWAFALMVLCVALAGCAVPVPLRETSAAGSIVVDRIDLDKQWRAAHWYLPIAEASTLVVFQHGFMRGCANLRESTRRLMAEGLMALCVDVPMAGGNPALAEAMATQLADEGVTPDGRALPRRVIVAGHSAGAMFALALGARLEAVAPGRLAGVLLVDPVVPSAPPPAADAAAAPEAAADNASGTASAAFAGPARFDAALLAVSARGRRPVLALLAPPHRCNAGSNALPSMRRAEQAARDAGSNAFVVVHLGPASTHADIEGEDTDALAEWACGTVRPERTAALRALIVDWARGVTRPTVSERGNSPAAGPPRPGPRPASD